ncbi:hypothetical protein TYRP_016544 [Tyrophagus putrescentiae]|nr:hypothetical protein TYRP_016544 [Tyrophagus putrescentiae]
MEICLFINLALSSLVESIIKMLQRQMHLLLLLMMPQKKKKKMRRLIIEMNGDDWAGGAR